MGCSRGAPVWRSAIAAAVALCLLPIVVPLVLLWLPLLCFAVAVVRFRRRRRRMVVTRGRCHFTSGERRPPSERDEEDAGPHRAALLHKYLEDQMELVESEAEAGDAHGSRASKKAMGSILQETEV